MSPSLIKQQLIPIREESDFNTTKPSQFKKRKLTENSGIVTPIMHFNPDALKTKREKEATIRLPEIKDDTESRKNESDFNFALEVRRKRVKISKQLLPQYDKHNHNDSSR